MEAVRPSSGEKNAAAVARLTIRFLLILFSLGTGLVLGQPRAFAETRTLKIYHVHTGEKAVITYKRNGRYVEAGLKKLDYILRDWRKDQEIDMDPRLMDLLWEVYQRSGSHDYIHIICGYRTADTNAMLRGRSRASGVAKKSQHILGKAADFFIPDVDLEKLREIGMKFQVGGVGYYPNSGSPFVHMDTGFVRAWPRMTREQLVRLFPNGNTLHLPRDGKPLPGYQTALASYKRRVTDDSIMVAGGSSAGRRSGGNLLAALFGGGGGDEDEGGLDAGNTVQSNPQLHRIETAAMAPVDAGGSSAGPAVLLPAAANAPLPGVRPTLVADVGPADAIGNVAAASPGQRRATGSGPPGAALQYPDLLAYAPPVPELPPAADTGRTLTADAGMQQQAAGPLADVTGSVSRAAMPVPGLRPEFAAYARTKDNTHASALAAVLARLGREPLRAADIAAFAGRKLTKGQILMASLGPIPRIRPPVFSGSRPSQHFASVSGEEIKGGRLAGGSAADAAPKARLTEEMLREWARAVGRGRPGTVADGPPAPRMNRLSPAIAEGRASRPRAVDPQRFAAVSVYFPND